MPAIYEQLPGRYTGMWRSPDYGDEAEVRRLCSNGEIKWKGRTLFVSNALVGEPVRLHRIGEDVWLVKYGPIVLCTLNGKGKIAEIPARQARSGSFAHAAETVQQARHHTAVQQTLFLR